MTITVFTSNQPRHLALIESLSKIASRVYAVQECSTIAPGGVDDFFRKSSVMQRYFRRVIDAEREIFGTPRFLPGNVRSVAIKMGDLNRLPDGALQEAMQADRYVVFGASYIKSPLCEFLVSRGALNIHMGVSPYYRGSSTNFWAMYDGRPDLVGATIHKLTSGLDSGPILFHALPRAEAVDPFIHGMHAVQAAHGALAEYLQSGRKDEPVIQDKSLEIRYTRNADFTDAVAEEYLNRLPAPDEMDRMLEKRDARSFVRPFVA